MLISPPFSAVMRNEIHHAYIEGAPDQVQMAIEKMDDIVKVVPLVILLVLLISERVVV